MRRAAGGIVSRLLPQAAQQAWFQAAAGARGTLAAQWAGGQAATTAASCCSSAAAAAARPTALLQQLLWRQLAAMHVQRVGIHTHRAGRPLLRRHRPPGRRTALRTALAAAAKAAGLAAVGVPAAGVAALVVAGRQEGADALQVLDSLPRTARFVWWGAWATWRYKALAAAHADDPGSAAYQRALAELHERAATKLLLAAQAAGGLYIKAGQLMVSLHAVPPQYRTILAALQDKVPPRPFADVDATLRAELGAPASQLFAEFEPAATAAASLAQVHKARLHDGSLVAVKVQYPGLEAAVTADLATMLALADAGHWLFPATSWRWLFEELKKQLRFELDFRNEAANATRLAGYLAGRRDVAVPRLHPQLCTARVLTMEWVEGCKLTDVDALVAQGLQPRAVGILLLDAFAEMTYYDGWTHGDPHPGNILVRPRPDPPPLLARLLGAARPAPQIVLLDHGIYIALPDRLRRLYCQLWGAIALGDMQTARLAAAELGGEQAGRILPEILRPRDWKAVPREERRRVRLESGISSFADVAQLLEAAPKPLLDSLRQGTVVRHSATLLGATIGDRLRINAAWAQRGMYRSSGPGPPEFVGRLQSRWERWRLALRVGLLRLAFAASAWVHGAAAYLVPE